MTPEKSQHSIAESFFQACEGQERTVRFRKVYPPTSEATQRTSRFTGRKKWISKKKLAFETKWKRDDGQRGKCKLRTIEVTKTKKGQTENQVELILGYQRRGKETPHSNLTMTDFLSMAQSVKKELSAFPNIRKTAPLDVEFRSLSPTKIRVTIHLDTLDLGELARWVRFVVDTLELMTFGGT